MLPEITIGLSRSFSIVTSQPSDEVELEVSRIMEALLALEGDNLSDAAVSLNLETLELEVEVNSSGDSFEDALRGADSAIRSAIHAAGGHTPGWDAIRTTSQHAELVRV